MVDHSTHTRRSTYIRDESCVVWNFSGLISADQTRPGAETTQKRFWKTVDVEKRGDELTVTLDKRPLKTPSGNVLLVPAKKHLLATLVAAEWENQERLIKPHSLPLVSAADDDRVVDADTAGLPRPP